LKLPRVKAFEDGSFVLKTHSDGSRDLVTVDSFDDHRRSVRAINPFVRICAIAMLELGEQLKPATKASGVCSSDQSGVWHVVNS
jgi:hypothetical protein